jgi:hypothetical protein
VLGAAVLAPELIRPYTQSIPPVVPDAGEAWMAFTIATEGSDTFPWTDQVDDATVALQRHERMRMLCSVYDTGISGRAAEIAALLRDGIAIPQNLETLFLAGMGLVAVEAEVALPSVLKTRWLWRVDQPVILTRQVDRLFAQQNIASANGTLKTDVGLPDTPINVEPNP